MALTTFVDGNVLYASQLNNNFVWSGTIPIGGVISWMKTFLTKDSGTTTGTTANKLVQSGQNFLTTVATGNLVYNTTDLTFAYVTAVDSDTQLSLSADIMVSGEAFTIYATPALDEDWVECNGQVLSDAGSIYNGATIPDLNTTQRFLRGAKFSGTTGGADSENLGHAHSISTVAVNSSGTALGLASGSTDGGGLGVISKLPAYYQVVFIMRIK